VLAVAGFYSIAETTRLDPEAVVAQKNVSGAISGGLFVASGKQVAEFELYQAGSQI
jgi:hypothetical protein